MIALKKKKRKKWRRKYDLKRKRIQRTEENLNIYLSFGNYTIANYNLRRHRNILMDVMKKIIRN
jgi:hypothetical protein